MSSVVAAEDHFQKIEEGAHQAGTAAGVALADQRSEEDVPMAAQMTISGEWPADPPVRLAWGAL